METDCWTPGFVNVAFSWEFLLSSMGATVTSPHFGPFMWKVGQPLFRKPYSNRIA